MTSEQRQLLRAGERAVGNWISIGHPAVAEICSTEFDFVIVDTEHAPMGLETLANVLRAVDEDVPALVRVPSNDPVRIKRVLDLGPAGVMIPTIERRSDAANAVEAVRYPPDGIRGVAPARASDYGRSFGEYFERANEELLTVVQIETERGVENAADIVSVEGVDAVIVGQGDLSASLDVFGEWESDEFRSALASVLEAAHDADKPVGMLALDRDGIRRWVDAGVDFLIAGADISSLASGSDAAREAFNAAVENVGTDG